MPIYAYKCSSCGHTQDHLQKISDPLLSACPQCGVATYQKQLTSAGFQLKGSGWYVTDFRGGQSGAPADAASAKPAAGAPPAATAPAATSAAAPAAPATSTTPKAT